jgi:hypothetical protein
MKSLKDVIYIFNKYKDDAYNSVSINANKVLSAEELHVKKLYQSNLDQDIGKMETIQMVIDILEKFQNESE